MELERLKHLAGVSLVEAMTATANEQAFLEAVRKKARVGEVEVKVSIEKTQSGDIYTWSFNG